MTNHVKIQSDNILSKKYYTLKYVVFSKENSRGIMEEAGREVYEMNPGVTVLLYNLLQRTVILTRQFRLPAFLQKINNGMMVEACAGIIDTEEGPEATILREIEEETGFSVSSVKKVFELLTSPGTLTEVLHYYVAEYSPTDRVSSGGGLHHEKEDIEVMEISIEQALEMLNNGDIKDAKTAILLLHAQVHIFKQ